MQLLLTFMLVVLVGIIGSRKIFISKPAYLGARHLLLTGTEYLLLGLLLGEDFFNILNPATLKALSPFVGFGLGWIGFLLGIQFEFKQLARLPYRYLPIGFIKTSIVLSAVFAASIFMLKGVFDFSGFPLVLGALIFAVTAASTSPSALALVDRYLVTQKPRALIKLLRTISSVDGLIATGVFGFSICTLHTVKIVDSRWMDPFLWLGVSAALGILIGYLFHFLISLKISKEELFLIIVGCTTLTSGIADFFKLSPLFINFLAGLVVANSRWANFRVTHILVKSEKAIYIIFLLLVGAAWHPNITGLWIGLMYVGIQMLGKTAGAFTSILLFRPDFYVPKFYGLALTSQGGLTLAILISFSELYSGTHADLIKSAVIFAVLTNALLSPLLIVWVLRSGMKRE